MSGVRTSKNLRTGSIICSSVPFSSADRELGNGMTCRANQRNATNNQYYMLSPYGINAKECAKRTDAASTKPEQPEQCAVTREASQAFERVCT